MTTKEKAAGVLPAPEAAIQKRDRAIIVGNIGRVNAHEQFGTMLGAMQAVGLAPAKAIDLIADGKLHRYRVEGDKPGSLNGWYWLRSGDAFPGEFGEFGSWKTDARHTWRQAGSKPLTPAERAALRKRLQEAQAMRASSQTAQYQDAAKRAEALLRQSVAATDDHPYLRRKRARAHGIRQKGNALLIPIRNARGEIQSIQYIHADGTKIFLRGGRTAGGFYLIGVVADVLLIAEGFATASTLHQATGHAVAVAFNCGNMPAVARALRAKFPASRIVVCADDDQQTPGNPGLTRAREAAKAVGGFLATPRFQGARHGV